MYQESIFPNERIVDKIYLIRGKKVMIDEDLALLYQIETRRLNEQVKRNLDRFPDDFTFQLTEEEYLNLTSQIAMSSWGGRRKLPYAFTEHGVLMLSSVLTSKIAIAVNIKIMRVFVQMRELILTNQDILIKLQQLEKQVSQNNDEIGIIFDALKELIQNPETERKQIGFKQEEQAPKQ